MAEIVYSEGDKVVVTNRGSSFYDLRGYIVEPHKEFSKHWIVMLENGVVPMMFSERELKKFSA